MPGLSLVDGVSWRAVNGKAIILHGPSSRYYTLNETATVIFRQALRGRSPAAIARAVSKSYGVSLAAAEADARRLQGSLVREGLARERA
ncbi:MAG: PqqD family protein [Elusimicrobiota bacterium]|nr:PqqD family protein [Elusimicrobiota bacterium]